MKKSFCTLALVVLTTLAANAQGTIAFGNGTLTRVTIRNLDGSIRGNALAEDGLVFAVFFGPAGTLSASGLREVVQAGAKATIGTTDGVMINAPSVYAIPGTNPGDVVSLQIRAWDAATGGQRMYGATDVRQVTLAPTAGPGAVIWQTAGGTNANRFTPLLLPSYIIPEPSTIALAALSLGSLILLRGRRDARTNGDRADSFAA